MRIGALVYDYLEVDYDHYPTTVRSRSEVLIGIVISLDKLDATYYRFTVYFFNRNLKEQFFYSWSQYLPFILKP